MCIRDRSYPWFWGNRRQGTLKKAFTQRLDKRTREKEEKPFKKRWLAEVFGISRQGYYKRMKHLETQSHQYELILSEVRKIRKLQPKYGTLKVFKELSFFFHQQGIKTVSYTHLDVYKRQVPKLTSEKKRQKKWILTNRKYWTTSVSYTHLDVYKRQIVNILFH